jgi:hypothetical protein
MFLSAFVTCLLQMSSEGRELRSEYAAVPAEPGIDFGERLRVEPVEASLCVDAYGDEPGILQCPEVPRDACSGHVELLGDSAGRKFFVLSEEFQHTQPCGIGQTVEHVHHFTVTPILRNVNVAQHFCTAIRAESSETRDPARGRRCDGAPKLSGGRLLLAGALAADVTPYAAEGWHVRCPLCRRRCACPTRSLA